MDDEDSRYQVQVLKGNGHYIEHWFVTLTDAHAYLNAEVKGKGWDVTINKVDQLGPTRKW